MAEGTSEMKEHRIVLDRECGNRRICGFCGDQEQGQKTHFFRINRPRGRRMLGGSSTALFRRISGNAETFCNLKRNGVARPCVADGLASIPVERPAEGDFVEDLMGAFFQVTNFNPNGGSSVRLW